MIPSLVEFTPNNWDKYLKKNVDGIDILEKIKDKLDLYNSKTEDIPMYPDINNIFNAFTYFDPSETRVIIIGQDCYHQANQATGLCFGVNNNVKIPPSLRNIKKELLDDLNIELQDTSLIQWAKQGVLLLNSSLTVKKSMAGCHLSIWKDYTDNIIKSLSDDFENIIFVLWGNFAKNKIKLINQNNKHQILTAVHPSPLSANKGGWFGNKHFSKINSILSDNNKNTINW